MRRIKIFSIFFISLHSLFFIGCVSYSVSPQVFVLNLYNSPVHIQLLNDAGKYISFDNIETGTAKPFVVLPEFGAYSVSWKTQSMTSWQVQQLDATFPDLNTGKYLFQRGQKYLLIVDRNGIIRIISLKEKFGYGARICLFNASSSDIAGFNLSGEESISKPYLEIKQIPADSTTHFLTIVPGKVVPEIFLNPAKGRIDLVTGMNKQYISMHDNSYYFILVQNREQGIIMDHYILSETTRL